MDRLKEVFAKRDANGDVVANEYVDGFVPFTDAEMLVLAEIPCVVVDRDFFQFYRYGINNMGDGRTTEFFNSQTLRTNHWAHIWGVVSSSPYANAFCITQTAQAVSSVTVSPSTATVSKGQTVQMSAAVVTTGFANKAVTWSVDSTSAADGITIDLEGKLQIPSTATVETVTVTATSVYDTTKTGTGTITIAENVTQQSNS